MSLEKKKQNTKNTKPKQPKQPINTNQPTTLLSQDWNFATVTKPCDLLTRTIVAAPDVSGACFWFWSTRNMLQEDSSLWWWQIETMREYCKNHFEACTFFPARDGQPKIITPADQQQTVWWPSVWGKDKQRGNSFSSIIAYCRFGKSPYKENHLSFLLCHSPHMDTIVFMQPVAGLSL